MGSQHAHTRPNISDINQLDGDLISGVQPRDAPAIILMGHKTAITDGPMGDNTP